MSVFLLNDLSIHGQYPSVRDFAAAIGRLFELLKQIEQANQKLHATRNLLTRQVTAAEQLSTACFKLSPDMQGPFMAWLSNGPFWDDAPSDTSDEYLEVDGDDVTKTGVGEAALRCEGGSDCCLVTMTPSAWMRTPVVVVSPLAESCRSVEVPNVWDAEAVAERLPIEEEPDLDDWPPMVERIRRACPGLCFATDAFAPLKPLPFQRSSAKRLMILFGLLQEMKRCCDAGDQVELSRLRQEYCVSKHDPFSSQMDDDRLRFSHPKTGQRQLFTWHGKVKHSHDPLRFHFSWPIVKGEPIYVVYVGQKLTKT